MKSIILNIGGKDRVFHFGLGFIGRMLEQTNTDMQDFDRLRLANPFKWIPLMFFYSLEYSYIRDNEPVDFDIYDVTEWIDELEQNSDVLIRFNEAFTKSLTRDVPLQPESKKKVTKK